MKWRVAIVVLLSILVACNLPTLSDEEIKPVAPSSPVEGTEGSVDKTGIDESQTWSDLEIPAGSKWTLWSEGTTQLRGANIWQAVVNPELDGTEFKGPGPVGPPYNQQDFDRLSILGANFVNISHPGLFSENPPYTLDQGIQKNLDNLLTMIARADMFAAISFRTGPGRSEYGLCCLDGIGDWLEPDYLNDSLWQDRLAQEAWISMWHHTAERYRDYAIVVAYDLMVEPNANDVGADAINAPLDIWEPEEFYSEYRHTLYDWNQLHPLISTAIRQVDSETPILIGGMAYSAIEWLPYLEPTGDAYTVYTTHHYEPFDYTHQEYENLEFNYPGEMDLDWDGEEDLFTREHLEVMLEPIDQFQAKYHVPVTVNEFGVVRWVPGAATFLNDQIDLFEQRGLNYALWTWETSWEPFAEEVHAFNFRLGSDPKNLVDIKSNDLLNVIVKYWDRNTLRPSSWLR